MYYSLISVETPSSSCVFVSTSITILLWAWLLHMQTCHALLMEHACCCVAEWDKWIKESPLPWMCAGGFSFLIFPNRMLAIFPLRDFVNILWLWDAAFDTEICCELNMTNSIKHVTFTQFDPFWHLTHKCDSFSLKFDYFS